MSEKYHISPKTGRPNKCYATKRPCPLSCESDHYPTKEAAIKSIEEKIANESIDF